MLMAKIECIRFQTFIRLLMDCQLKDTIIEPISKTTFQEVRNPDHQKIIGRKQVVWINPVHYVIYVMAFCLNA
jgi:hypothetical protein